MKNIACFKNGFIIPENALGDNLDNVHTLQLNLMDYGFIMSADLVSKMAYSSRHSISALTKEIIEYLKSEDDKDKPSFGYRIINIGDEKDYQNVFTKMLFSKNVMTNIDTICLEYFLLSGDVLIKPDVIPNKSNIIILTRLRVENIPNLTIHDGLMIVIYFMTYIKHKNRRFEDELRTYIYGLLENISLDTSVMNKNRHTWLQFKAMTNHEEAQETFPCTFLAFEKLEAEYL